VTVQTPEPSLWAAPVYVAIAGPEAVAFLDAPEPGLPKGVDVVGSGDTALLETSCCGLSVGFVSSHEPENFTMVPWLVFVVLVELKDFVAEDVVVPDEVEPPVELGGPNPITRLKPSTYFWPPN
jgi:hypothetical protein